LAYQKEILEKLTLRTISYLKNDLCLPYDNEPTYTIKDVQRINYLGQIAYISFKGDIQGQVGMSISHSFSRVVAKAFVYGDMDDDELAELSKESSKEVLNVTIGNIISDLTVVKNGGTVDITTPLSSEEQLVIKNEKENDIMCISHIKYNDNNIILSFIQ